MSMTVNPGKLDKKISIFKTVSGVDEDTGFDTGSTEKIIREPWASFSRTSGTEQIKSGKEMTDVKCRFLIRHSKTDLDNTMLIRYRGDVYNILYINDYEDSHEYDEIWCEKVV